SHLARQAERTAHRAAHLSRNAERLPRCVRDKDRLDVTAVLQSQFELGGAVGGNLTILRYRRRDREGRRQPRAKRTAEIRHGVETRDAALIDPLEDLSA